MANLEEVAALANAQSRADGTLSGFDRLHHLPKVAEYGNLGLSASTTSWLHDKLQFVLIIAIRRCSDKRKVVAGVWKVQPTKRDTCFRRHMRAPTE